jgi:glutathione S-transferase
MGFARAERDWLVGGKFSAADTQMSFVGEVADVFSRFAIHPNIKGWVDRFQARPAYCAALEKGDPYGMGPKP